MKTFKTQLPNYAFIVLSILDFVKRCNEFAEEMQKKFPGIKIDYFKYLHRNTHQVRLEELIADSYFRISLSQRLKSVSARFITIDVTFSGLIEIISIGGGEYSGKLKNVEKDFGIKVLQKKYYEDSNELVGLLISQAEFERLLPKFVKFLKTGEI